MTSRAEGGAGGSTSTDGTAPRAQLVGTGLIGGSLGLALRHRGWFVTGRDTDGRRAKEALDAWAIDAVGDDPDAEIAFVAVPAAFAAPEARVLLSDERRRPDLVVSDVSGVKAAVVDAVGHPRFVGGHPMAGSEQVGLDGAHRDLFVGVSWVLTPTTSTDLAAFELLRTVVTSLGADVVVLSPEDHDRMVAMVSHVPHLVAATLMNAAAAGAREDAALLRLAAGGFRDMTRVAAGHPGIWPDVCADNAPAILTVLDQLLADLTSVRGVVAGTDRAGLLDVLERASAARQALPARATRPENLSEVRVPVPDRKGVIADIASRANASGVNIYDIEIAHSAEGPQGVMVLVVETSLAAELCRVLNAAGYRATTRELS
jgi:prephenate dehydrogenase